MGKRQTSKDAFRALLGHTHKRTKLFSEARVIQEYPPNIHNSMLGALASLATHSRAWIRPLETWKPTSKNARRQLSELARHLLAEYPVPAFMDSVWFKRSRSQNWFLHIGQGQNIRTAERLLVPLNKKMAHAFSLAPADYTVEHAFRWAQVHGLGGNERAVEAVRATRLGRSFAHDDFWISVLRFLAANPMLDTVHYGPIVDYVHEQKFAAERIFVRPGEVRTLDPPHPGFSMSRRTPDTLLRQVTAWHRQLGKVQVVGDRAWHSSGIQPLHLVEGKDKKRVWTLDELLSTNALIEEGRAMKHCVGSYAASCAAGRSSVWTLRFSDGAVGRRRLTVEVQPRSRTMVEARGRFNAYPTEQEMRVLQHWAEQNELTIPSYISR